MPSEQVVIDAGLVLVAIGAVALGLAVLVRWLGRYRHGFAIGLPIIVGTALRVVAVLAIAFAAPSFRGPDDAFWADQSRAVARLPLIDVNPFAYPLHVWTFSMEMRLGLSETAMRIVEAGIGIAGIVLLAAAAYDLAGPRAAVIVSWVLALEPAAAYFGGQLLKEAFMTLAIGLVAFAAVGYWRRPRMPELVLLIGACGLATWVRPYAGWGLSAGAAALVVYRGVARERGWRPGARLIATVTAIVGLVALPAVVTVVASGENLSKLEAIQEVNATSGEQLALQPVAYSAPSDLVVNLPRRTVDLLLRPYPWQLANTNQALGLLGTIAALVTLTYLLLELFLSAGKVLRRTAPFLIPGAFLLAAFAVTAGNAGSSYRHRAQLLTLGVASAVVLRERRRHAEAALDRSRERQPSFALREEGRRVGRLAEKAL